MGVSAAELPLADYYPFTNQYLEIEGKQIHYIEEGSPAAPTILFLHGNPTWSFLYRNVIIELKSSFHCLALDYPGFGLSEQPADFDYLPESQTWIVHQFIDRLGLDSFSLFMHDWGGPIGLAVAGQRPELITSLVITNTWAWPPEKRLLRLFSRLLGSKVGKQFILRWQGFVNCVMPWGVVKDRKQFKEKILPFYRLSAARPTYIFPREIIGSNRFLAKVESNLSKLANKPSLLLWGKWDPMFRSRVCNKFKQLLKPEKAVSLSAGHYLMEDRPQEISREVKDFLS